MNENQIPKYATEIFANSATIDSSMVATAVFEQSASKYTSVLAFPSATASGGGFVKSIIITTDNSAAANVVLAIKRGSEYRHLAVIPVPINSGALGTVATVDALDGTWLKGLQLDGMGKRFLSIQAGDELVFGILAQLSAGKKLQVRAEAMRFVANP